MCAIPQLVSAPLNPIPIAEHFIFGHIYIYSFGFFRVGLSLASSFGFNSTSEV